MKATRKQIEIKINYNDISDLKRFLETIILETQVERVQKKTPDMEYQIRLLDFEPKQLWEEKIINGKSVMTCLSNFE